MTGEDRGRADLKGLAGALFRACALYEFCSETGYEELYLESLKEVIFDLEEKIEKLL